MKALTQSLRGSNSAWFWLPLAVFFAAVVADIDLPGLYMDAINPDYMVPRMLGAKALNSIWIMPGNLLFERWPILPSLYHGTGMAWIGLPLYALLGTDIYAVRLVHGLYGALILAIGLILLHRFGVWRWLIGLVGLAIALDPSFIFSFRTQFYITAAPMALIIGAVYLLHESPVDGNRQTLLWSGLLTGLAIFGYFIYAFFVPALAVAVYFWRRNVSPNSAAEFAPQSGSRDLLVWSAGLFLGLLPYAAGFLLMIVNKGSLASFVDYVAGLMGGLQVAKSSTDAMGRFEAVWVYFLALVNHTAQSSYWSSDVQPLRGGVVKALGLVLLPLALWLVAEWRKTATCASRLMIGLCVSFFVGASIFGARLGSHHFVPVMVLLYLALAGTLFEALGARNAATWVGAHQRPRKSQWVVMLSLVGLCAYNLHAQLGSRAQLRETGGIGLYSDAINRFAADINAHHRGAIHFMPDWGIWMPAVFLTGGKIDIVADENDRHARWLLCQGREARWVLINGDIPARTAAITARLDWPAPATTVWKQRDGRRVFDVITYQPAGDNPDLRRRCQSS